MLAVVRIDDSPAMPFVPALPAAAGRLAVDDVSGEAAAEFPHEPAGARPGRRRPLQRHRALMVMMVAVRQLLQFSVVVLDQARFWP